ncbi:ATP synthase subunit I [Luteitalea sp.]|uniref:ATP synthase subunit I n=1 Tax=Luteitalea sp. TaxID=2004800 RepID=UPI0037CBC156
MTAPTDLGLTARLERDTLIVLALSTAVALALGGWRLAGGVVGGGVLAGISYRALKRGVEALGPPPPGLESRRLSPARVALGLVGRYALLLAAGYVIIGRLHLHPLGVLVGVSAVVVAAMAEAVRAWR